MEAYEGLRRNMMYVIENRGNMPADIMNLAIEMCERLEEQYDQVGCNNSSIRDYIQGNLNELMAKLQQIGSTMRKENQYDEVQAFLQKVEKDFEEKVDDEEQKSKDNNNKDIIGEICSNGQNNRMTPIITDEIQSTLKDIQSRQNKILATRGYSDRQIEAINDEVLYFIRNSKLKNEEQIYEALQGDDQELRKQLISVYDQYMDERQNGEKTNQEMFRESLDAGISLEEQSDNAKAFIENEDNRTEEEKRASRESLDALFK